MKRFLRSRIFKVLVCIGILGLIVAIGIVEPRGAIGRMVFKSAYAFPPARPAVLRFYTWSLKEFEGGYLPPGIDEFLIRRLAFCGDEPEETAVIDFQIRQGSGRWGGSASRSDDTRQKQMIANLMKRLDRMSDRDAVESMVFIESLRRETPLGKGGFAGMWTYSNATFTLNRRAFDSAKEGFRKWWGDGEDWPGLRADDPLAGTGLSIHSGP